MREIDASDVDAGCATHLVCYWIGPSDEQTGTQEGQHAERQHGEVHEVILHPQEELGDVTRSTGQHSIA